MFSFFTLQDMTRTLCRHSVMTELRQTGWFVRTFIVLLPPRPPPPPLLHSWRLYVVLIKVLWASEERACRRRSLRERRKWARGFVTPLFLFIPTLPLPPLRLPHLCLLLDLCSSGLHIKRLPPIILRLIYASPPSIRRFTSIVKPRAVKFGGVVVMPAAARMCQDSFAEEKWRERRVVGNMSSLFEWAEDGLYKGSFVFIFLLDTIIPRDNPDVSPEVLCSITAA